MSLRDLLEMYQRRDGIDMKNTREYRVGPGRKYFNHMARIKRSLPYHNLR